MNERVDAPARPLSPAARLRRVLRIGFLREPLPAMGARGLASVNQLPSAIAALIVIALFLVADTQAALSAPGVWIGFVAIAAATVAASVLPWTRWPEPVVLLVPLMDMLAFFVMSLAGFKTLTGISILMALPLFWLAWSRYRTGLVLAVSFLLPLGVVWGQTILAGSELSTKALIKPLLVPVVLFAFTMTIAVMSLAVARAQRSARRALEKAERHAVLVNTVLNTANVGVVVVDEGGHDLMMNDTQRTIHDSLIPEDDSDPNEAGLLIFGADRTTPLPADQRPVRRAVLGEDYSGQLVWGGRPEAMRAFNASASQMLLDGQHHGAVIAFHDVTDLLEALAAKDQFLATVNHELRTPLTSIVGYLEMASESADLDPAVKVYLRVAERNAERLLALVGDLLDAAAGKVEISRKPVDLTEVLEGCLPSHSARAERLAVSLSAKVTNRLDLLGDERRLGQIVDNLLSNALKYTPAGGSVNVSTYRSETGDPILEVTDTGQGMTVDELGRLFTRFYRTDTVRRSAIPGAGLGLAITKDLVEEHGGSISVSSEPGIGSTFKVQFPDLDIQT
ncbi:sensor histidine kinase [Arthrobacter rhombi]|uniref:sensor histidine kinase n=1 Tax=Arthrobacter rhombi TaxID=71253 RepID=UPI003FD4F344